MQLKYYLSERNVIISKGNRSSKLLLCYSSSFFAISKKSLVQNSESKVIHLLNCSVMLSCLYFINCNFIRNTVLYLKGIEGTKSNMAIPRQISESISYLLVHDCYTGIWFYLSHYKLLAPVARGLSLLSRHYSSLKSIVLKCICLWKSFSIHMPHFPLTSFGLNRLMNSLPRSCWQIMICKFRCVKSLFLQWVYHAVCPFILLIPPALQHRSLQHQPPPSKVAPSWRSDLCGFMIS